MLKVTVDPEDAKRALAFEFARNPTFLDEIRQLVVDGVFSESGSLFDYLFIPASRLATGTDHEVVGFRLRNPQEFLIARTALGLDEIGLTHHPSPSP